MPCFFANVRFFLPSPMVARKVSGLKSRLFLLATTEEPIPHCITKKRSLQYILAAGPSGTPGGLSKVSHSAQYSERIWTSLETSMGSRLVKPGSLRLLCRHKFHNSEQ